MSAILVLQKLITQVSHNILRLNCIKPGTYFQNLGQFEFRPTQFLMHKSINFGVGAGAQRFWRWWHHTSKKMYWAYESFMRGKDQVSTSIISLQQRYTDLCSALHSDRCSQTRPFFFFAEMRWVKYWFVIIPPHQGHAFSPRHCHVSALWQHLLMWTLINTDTFFYVVWCSLRRGCRPFNQTSTQSILAILLMPVARRGLMDLCLCSPESTLGTLLFWNVCYQS